MRKYLIILSTILIMVIFYVEKITKPQNINLKKIENNSKKITEFIDKDDTLVMRDNVTIKNGFYCGWVVKEDFAYGIYSKKSFLPRFILKDTELKIEWVTDKKVMLPGLVNSIPNQDTVICAKTSKNQEIYIVIVKGNKIKIINKGKKAYYSGNVSIADLEDLQKAFIIKN